MRWAAAVSVVATFVGVGVFAGAQSGKADEAVRLSVPISCDLGRTCFVQNYVDLDSGPGTVDMACGSASYNGHKGTDFRVLNTQVTAEVLASAPGTVKALRDGVPDKLLLSKEDRTAVEGRECGNGLVLDHGGGWETQYCHLRQGSVAVEVGDSIERGQVMGLVGYSGFAAFPHVHLTVRKNGVTVDPFLGAAATGARAAACGEGTAEAVKPDAGLWLEPGVDFSKDAAGSIIQLGFADGPIGTRELETGVTNAPTAGSAALVFFARLINLRQGDRVVLRLNGPQGEMAVNSGDALPRTKAQWVAYTGRKLRDDGWPAGTYSGEALLVRDNAVFRRKAASLTLR